MNKVIRTYKSKNIPSYLSNVSAEQYEKEVFKQFFKTSPKLGQKIVNYWQKRNSNFHKSDYIGTKIFLNFSNNPLDVFDIYAELTGITDFKEFLKLQFIVKFLIDSPILAITFLWPKQKSKMSYKEYKEYEGLLNL